MANYVLANHEDMEEWIHVYDEEKASHNPRDRNRFHTICEFMKIKIKAFDEGTLYLTSGKNILYSTFKYVLKHYNFVVICGFLMYPLLTCNHVCSLYNSIDIAEDTIISTWPIGSCFKSYTHVA